MRIANAEIPIAEGQTPESVFSNLIYLFLSLTLSSTFGWTALPLSAPLAALAFGSSLFHATGKSEKWAQLMDAVPIQWCMAGLLSLSLAALTSVPVWLASVPLPPIYVLWWEYAHLFPRNPAIAVQGIGVLVCLFLHSGIWPAVLVASLIGGAFALHMTGGTHSVKHAGWHLLSGLAIAIGAAFLLI